MNNILKNKYNSIFDIMIDKYKSMSLATRAALWFVFCSTLQKVISIITTPIFTRLLTASEYGEFSIYNSWLSIFSILTTFRLEYAVFNKGMSKYSKNRDEYTLSMQSTTSILTAICFVIYLVFRNNINEFTELSTFITICMFVELFFQPAINLWMIRERYDFKYVQVVIITILITLSNSVLGVMAVLLSENKGVARILSCVLVQVCFGLIIYTHNIRRGKKLFTYEYIRFAILFNIPLIPHYISTYILEQADRIMIQKICGIDKAGIYSVVYNAALVMRIITNSVNNALSPWQYRKLESKEFDDIEKQFNKMIVLVMVILVLFMAFAPEIIKILASSEYYDAVYIIPPVSASTLLILMYGLFSNVEFYYNANKFTMYLSLIGAILNIILNYICIKLFGYMAAGYTTLICYILFTVAHFAYSEFIVKKYEGRRIFSTKVVLGIISIITILSIVLSILYNYAMLRFIIIAFIIILIVYKRDKFYIILNNIKK